EREERIKYWANQDRQMLGGYAASYEVGVEQEPGSGGKESAEATIRNLAGFRVFADKVTGSKEVRAEFQPAGGGDDLRHPGAGDLRTRLTPRARFHVFT